MVKYTRRCGYAILGIAVIVGVGLSTLSAQEPKTGYCGENGGLHEFTLGPGSDIGGYSHGPEPGSCSELHPSIHEA